ncbi:MAG: type II secretion system F family protein [Opitutales bacterium]
MLPGKTAARRHDWYAQLAQTLGAGIDLPSALEQSGGPSLRERTAMADRLRRGAPLEEVLQGAACWLPEADRQLLAAGAASGRLAETCERLAADNAALAAEQRALFLAALYPLVVLHLALAVLPLGWSLELPADDLPSLDLTRYGLLAGLGLVLVWGGGLLTLLASRLWPAAVERLARPLPGVGRYLHHRALSRFAETLEALLEAGARYPTSVTGAALAVSDTRVRPAILGVQRELGSGQPLSALLPRLRAFPPAFTQLFCTAEQTGGLAHTLPQLAERYAASARRALRLSALLYPKLLFLAVAVLVGLGAARFYRAYLDFVLSLGQ